MSSSHAAIGHFKQPFSKHHKVWAVPAGTRLGDTRPNDPQGPMLCRVNGGPGYAPRAADDYLLQPADVVEWLEFPMGGGGKNAGAIQIIFAALVSIATENPYPLVLALAGAAVTAFTANDRAPEELKDTSPTYTTGLQGNAARLYNVIPKLCGRNSIFPPYASQPYNEYSDAGEQYLYVVMAIGIGNHEIERILIDDTDIQHFSDVLTVRYLEPGVQPTSVLTNVINSPEVGNQELLTGAFVGGFAACAPRRVATHIGIDIIAPRGLGEANETGDLFPLEISWRIDVREINDFGTPITPWVVLATETRTIASKEPQRWGNKYALPSAFRPEVRVVRLDPKLPQVRYLNEFVWSAMRAYLEDFSTLNPAVAHLEVVMRSSKQLTGVSQSRIRVIATGMARVLNADLTFGAEVATRNGPTWLADLLTNTDWGEGRAVEYVDLQTLYDLSVLADERQDRFDFVFDTSMDADEAAQLIADTFRATVFDRSNGVRTLSRDQLATLPRTAFHPRNTVPDSMQVIEQLPRENDPDGYIIEHVDNRSWNYGIPIECPMPGVVTMLRPVRLRLAGITGPIHATREGLFKAAKLAYRRRTASCVTELQGSLPAFGSAVRWTTEFMKWQAGDVVQWDADSLTAQLSEPPNWSGTGPLTIVLIGDQGEPSDPIEIVQGSTDFEVVLAEAPPFNPTVDDGTRDRTQYLLGRIAEDELIVKVSSIGSGGKQGNAQLYEIGGYVDDARIHEVDNALLPSPGEVQDPIDTSEGTPGGGTFFVVYLTGAFVPHDPPNYVGFRFGNDGSLISTTNGGPGTFDFDFQWLYQRPVGTEVTSQFEIMAQYYNENLADLDTVGSDLLDVWLNLGTTRNWQTIPGDGINARSIGLRISIREISTGIVQDSDIYSLLILGAPP